MDFSVAARWSAKDADHFLAVHFCCEQHKNNYVRALFEPAEIKKQHTSARKKTSRSSGLVGGGVSLGLGTLSGTTETKSKSKTTPKNKARGSRRSSHRETVKPARFDANDEIRAHGLSVRLADSAKDEPLGDYSSST